MIWHTLSLYQKGKLALGDEIKIHFKPLSIDSQSRVVGMDWNPFNYKEVSITVGQYLPTINDSLYEIAGEVYLICGDPQIIDQSSADAWYKVQKILDPLPALIISMGDQVDAITDALTRTEQFHLFTKEHSVPIATVSRIQGHLQKGADFIAGWHRKHY